MVPPPHCAVQALKLDHSLTSHGMGQSTTLHFTYAWNRGGEAIIAQRRALLWAGTNHLLQLGARTAAVSGLLHDAAAAELVAFAAGVRARAPGRVLGDDAVLRAPTE